MRCFQKQIPSTRRADSSTQHITPKTRLLQPSHPASPLPSRHQHPPQQRPRRLFPLPPHTLPKSAPQTPQGRLKKPRHDPSQHHAPLCTPQPATPHSAGRALLKPHCPHGPHRPQAKPAPRRSPSSPARGSRPCRPPWPAVPAVLPQPGIPRRCAHFRFRPGRATQRSLCSAVLQQAPPWPRCGIREHEGERERELGEA